MTKRTFFPAIFPIFHPSRLFTNLTRTKTDDLPYSTPKMINIRRDVQDSFYRYKMPKLQAKVEGKGNGIKTLIVNMVDVAKALHRPPTCTSVI